MKYDILTKYIPIIQAGPFGQWIIDRENNGTPEHPFQMPYVDYSEIVNHFINDVYSFEKRNEEMGLTHYQDILNDNGIKWNRKLMQEADTSVLDGQCVMALIMGAIRADRFCEGALLNFFQEGGILKWLKRLCVCE